MDEVIDILPDETDFDHAIELEEMRAKVLEAKLQLLKRLAQKMKEPLA